MGRMEKVNELLLHELSSLIQRETLGSFATVTEVKTSPDLRTAKIWIALPLKAKKEQNDQMIAQLQNKAHFFQKILGKKLDLRYIPKLHFELDTAGEHAARVDEILRREGR